MNVKDFFKANIQTYSRLRSLNYFVQYNTLNSLGRLMPFVDVRKTTYSPRMLKLLVREIDHILHDDATNIANGVYPLTVLRPEPLFKHLKRVPRVFLDGLGIGLRRKLKKTKSFSAEANVDKLPEYYLRNFHFQTDGYLSESSAELYEHQVELLFSGTADPMRRLLLAPAKTYFSKQPQRPLRFLELGCGTGTMTRFMRETFAHAEITAIDLSAPYIKLANEKSNGAIMYTFGDAAALNFIDGEFDFVYSVFLFHELPRAVRETVNSEAHRVLKRGGIYGYVDSLQLGDNPEFDNILKRFPIDFHEPFYADYIRSPMTELLPREKFKAVEIGHRFLSKFGVFEKI
jgi:ubiquinone/menaquinone biosynthesis C-methylase UbiE